MPRSRAELAGPAGLNRAGRLVGAAQMLVVTTPPIHVFSLQPPGRVPIFIRKMQPSRTYETNGARFDVDFIGVPPPEITWFREDFPITPSHDFKVGYVPARHVRVDDSDRSGAVGMAA